MKLDEQLVDEGERFRTPQQVREEAPLHGRPEREVVVDVELERDEVILDGVLSEPLEDVSVIASADVDGDLVNRFNALNQSTKLKALPPVARRPNRSPRSIGVRRIIVLQYRCSHEKALLALWLASECFSGASEVNINLSGTVPRSIRGPKTHGLIRRGNLRSR